MFKNTRLPFISSSLPTTVLLFASLCLISVPAHCQSAPPPPPAEGLDPNTAPASSTVPAPQDAAAPKQGDQPSAPGNVSSSTDAAPPPPSEGLNPNTAPASSTLPSDDMSTHAQNHRVKPTQVDGNSTNNDTEPADVSPLHTSPATVFKLDFMQLALLAGLIVSAVCAFLGVYVVLRRIVFVGVALAEMSSAGVALGLLINIAPMIGSVIMMLAGVVLLSIRWAKRKVAQDAFIGIGYVVASALAVLLISKSAQGEGHLLDLLFGNILTITKHDIQITALALGLVLVCHTLFYKELLFISFDHDTAAAAGYKARYWEGLLYITIGLTIAFAIHAVGVLMTFAMLTIPAVTALLVTKRMWQAFTGSIIAGMIPVPIGLYLSYIWDLPAHATIVAIGFVLLVIVGIVSRIRG